jgi:hypothetical protein
MCYNYLCQFLLHPIDVTATKGLSSQVLEANLQAQNEAGAHDAQEEALAAVHALAKEAIGSTEQSQAAAGAAEQALATERAFTRQVIGCAEQSQAAAPWLRWRTRRRNAHTSNHGCAAHDSAQEVAELVNTAWRSGSPIRT